MSATGSHRTTFLDSIRAVAIVMVVAIHARALVDLTPSVESVVHFVVSTIAVPVFFLCDGYLFAIRGAKRSRAGYVAYLGRSAQRLLIPWVIFSVLYTVARGVFEWAGVVEQHIVVGRSPWQVALEVYSSGVAPQMYFLLSLFLIRVGVFAFGRLAVGPVAIPWICFVVYTLIYRGVWADPLREFFSTGFDPVLHAAWGLQYYLLGIALARLGAPRFRRDVALSVIAWAILGAGLGFGLWSRWPGVVQYAYLVGAFCTFMALGDRTRFLARLGSDSMGIYLLHAPVLLRAVAIPISLFADSPIVFYVCICVGATVLSWIASHWLQKYSVGRWMLGMPSVQHG